MVLQRVSPSTSATDLMTRTLFFEDRIVVPKGELCKVIMNEAHNSLLSIHPGSTKMYQDLKQTYWWTRMKREIAQFVNECDVCRRVKAEHQRPAGLLQPLAIPEWKFDHIDMDFVTGFPKPSVAMMLYLLSSTSSPKWLIFCLSKSRSLQLNWRNSIPLGLSLCTVFHK